MQNEVFGRPSPAALTHPSNQAAGSRLSVTDIDIVSAGAGFSTATVSTTGGTGCLIRRVAFITGARLGLAFATVRFVAFAAFALRLPRLAEFFLRSVARF
jgi:hypothetical protein